MSSGTPNNPAMGNALAKAAPVGDDRSGPQLTPRQLLLHWRWAFYAARPYAQRAHDWDGRPVTQHVEHEAIASQKDIPPGYVDVSGASSELPLKFRKPTVAYHIVRAIVNRFSGMLFSAKRCPKIRVPDDHQTEDWLTGFAEDAGLWARMKLARTYGGAMGAVGVGLRFAEGKPIVEIHDPRWCMPEYEDRDTGILASFEKRYVYQLDIPDPHKRGAKIAAWFWYRRLIDKTADRTWSRVACDQVGNVEPVWANLPHDAREHRLGFCPVVWIQNMPLDEGPDGWTDVEGVHELQLGIDALLSQAHKGTIKNSDPTTVLSSDAEDPEGVLKKGSDHGVQVEKGGGMSYLEMSGSGIETALKLIDKYRDFAQEISRCVLDANFDGPARTETETEANYSAMVEAADDLRTQYGRGVKQLLEMALRAARQGRFPRAVVDADKTRVVAAAIKLTPRVVEGPNGEKIRAPRVLGQGEILELHWPEYRQHSLDDLGKVTDATVKAAQASLVDRETAMRKIAPYYEITDVRATLSKANAEQEAQVQQMNDEIALRGQQAGGGEGA